MGRRFGPGPAPGPANLAGPLCGMPSYTVRRIRARPPVGLWLLRGSRYRGRGGSPLATVPVAIKLAAAPVSSPDLAVTALATVDMVHDGAKITLTLIDGTSAAVGQQGR